MGAWIETILTIIANFVSKVAPRVGAWIETHAAAGLSRAQTSHPVWVRGLKHTIEERKFLGKIVAPRVGAWIETLMLSRCASALMSHPVWVRGLKQRLQGLACIVTRVAPRVGAWIETCIEFL